MLFFRTCLSLVIAILLSGSVFGNFDNYFRELANGENTEQAESKINEALTSIVTRVEIPYVADDGSIQTKGFFQKLERKAKEIDPTVQVYIAGGVVRSMLGFLYSEVWKGHHREPEKNTITVLDSIIHGTLPKYEKFLSTSVLGIGSDLDLLITTDTPEKEETLLHEITEFINSVEEKSEIRSISSKFKYSIVPIGDVKSYQAQLDRTISQGGNDLDWLAFPISTSQTIPQKMKMPVDHPQIFHHFILGTYNYLPATESAIQGDEKKKIKKDTDKQTIRGLRPLLEIPYLHLSDAGRDQMKKELDILIHKANEEESLSSGAMEQFEKMIRNARFEGAHNRFYSFDSTGEHTKEIENLVSQLSTKMQKRDKNLPIIPEFLVNRDIRSRGTTDKCELKKHNVLMSKEEFIQKHTNEGKLYHGTPHIDSILSIIRNGFIVSSAQQGMAACGKGAYMTCNKNTAAGYGIPIEFSLKERTQPRIVNLESTPDIAKKIPALEKLLESKQLQEKDLPQYLAENCDVDIVISQHILIQNSGAIQFPKNIHDLIILYTSTIREKASKSDDEIRSLQASYLFNELIDQYKEFQLLSRLSGALGIHIAPLSLHMEFLIEQYRKIVQQRIDQIIAEHPLTTDESDHIIKEKYVTQPLKELDASVMVNSLKSFYSSSAYLISEKVKVNVIPFENLFPLISIFLSSQNVDIFFNGIRLLTDYYAAVGREGHETAYSLVENEKFSSKMYKVHFTTNSNFSYNLRTEIAELRLNLLKKCLPTFPDRVIPIIEKLLSLHLVSYNYLNTSKIFFILEEAATLLPAKILHIIQQLVDAEDDLGRYKIGIKLRALLPLDFQQKVIPIRVVPPAAAEEGIEEQ